MKKIKNPGYFLILWSILFLFFAISSNVSYAGSLENVRGWLWGGSEDDADDLAPADNVNGLDGTMGGINGGNTPDGNDTMLYWISMNSANGSGTINYGVNIPVSGAATGYAWSDQVGWIDFGNKCTTGTPGADQYKAASCTNPVGGVNGVSRSGNSLVGWARIVSIATASAAGNSGGWSGWIRLNGTAGNGNPYGVVVNDDGTIGDPTSATTKMATSFAWSEELGWVDFSRVSIITIIPLAGTLAAEPSSCSDCTELPGVDLKATKTAGSGTGPITYKFDCTNDGSSIEHTYTGAVDTYTCVDCCTYNATSTAKVIITQDGDVVEPETTISLSPPCVPTAPDCDETTCEDDTCNNGCRDIPGTKRCDLNWQEVQP